MMKKQLILYLTVVALLIGIWSSAAQSHDATVQWVLPTNTVLNGDCAVSGFPIPAEYLIVTTVRWRQVGATAWNMAITNPGETAYVITNLSPSTSYEIQVGPNYVGMETPPLCFTDTVTITTPAYEPPKPCTNVTATLN